jgi:hypothetical protein
MKKISTVFKKDPNNLGRVINEVNPENQWVIDGEGIAYRKYDGTACAIIDGKLYKRFDLKPGRSLPDNAIPCCEPDETTGHHPHWVPCVSGNPEDRWHWEAYHHMDFKSDGTYELVGPKINGNKDDLVNHKLVDHQSGYIALNAPRSFDGLKEWLSERNIEGVVFHHPDGRMAKIRRKDFGLKW